MPDKPEPKDPASMLKRHFTTLQLPDKEPPRYTMSDRNRAKLLKIQQRVRELRGEK
jgi:hypothetical protein